MPKYNVYDITVKPFRYKGAAVNDKHKNMQGYFYTGSFIPYCIRLHKCDFNMYTVVLL